MNMNGVIISKRPGRRFCDGIIWYLLYNGILQQTLKQTQYII